MTTAPRSLAAPVLSVRAVEHRLGTTGPVTLRLEHLEVRPGEVVGLAGRSGTGKTTLCHLVAGLGAPTTGQIEVDGRPADSVLDWAVVSLLPQGLALVEEMTVADNVRWPLVLRRGGAGGPGRGRGGRGAAPPPTALPDVAELLDLLGLGPLAGRLVGQTSLGEQQRAALARALVLGPALAVLDEPTAHQDDDHVNAVLAAIRAARDSGTAVLVATHDDRVLAAADRVERLGAPV